MYFLFTKITGLLVVLNFFCFLSGCNFVVSTPKPAKTRLRIATTTSLADSGLLDFIISSFTLHHKINVDVIAVGSGKAFVLAKRGDVDLVLVHDKENELKFVNSGYGINRREIMYNDFLVVGPATDPAKIKGVTVVKALRNIAQQKKNFISRGDESGTHQKEKVIWQLTNLNPQGDWYKQTGQGMGTTLLIATEKQAYCLVDRGTYMAFKNRINLVPLGEGDNLLLNYYSVIITNPNRYPHLNYYRATNFVNFITSRQGQQIINEFKIKGERIFYPIIEL